MKIRWIIAGVLLLASGGCRGKSPSVPPPSEPRTFDEDGKPVAGPDGTAPEGRPSRPAAPKGCKAGGTAWDGKHEGCLYEVAGCCYPDAASACTAAGCDGDTCQVLESAPAQITCRAG